MTKSFDLAAQLDACAREPIHSPGSIQPHGMLFAVTRADLRLAAVSENAAIALRSTPQELIGGPISQVLDDPSARRLATLLRADPPTDTIAVRLRQPAPPAEWEALVHRCGGLMLVELEPCPPTGGDALVFGRAKSGIERIRQSASVAEACDALARGIRLLSGYERVMVYRFDPYWNGEVVAEDKAADAHSYLGHSFPASDIPAQARALYLHNTFRLIPDAGYVPCRVIPDMDPTTGAPIDLSDAALRSVSPIHCEYLANMGVVSSMSLSVIKGGALWALVACHHPVPRFVSHQVRQGCELLTQAMAWSLDTSERIFASRAIEAVRTQETEVMAGARGKLDCRSILKSIAPALLHQAGAQGLALSHPDDIWTAGITPDTAQIRTIVEWLSAGGGAALFTDRVAELCPAALEGATAASGIAATRIPAGWLLWFRSEWPHTIRWAGDPTGQIAVSADTGRINPRKSFQTWREDVRGQSRPWDPWQQATVTEAAHLVTRLLFRDQESNRRAVEHRTNRLLSERAGELERLTGDLRSEIEQRTAAQAALRCHRDNLEREVAERTAAVVASEARLADAIETLPDAFILFDAEDRLVACNAAYRAIAEISAHHFKAGISYEELWRITLQSGVATIDNVDTDQWFRNRMVQRRAIGSQIVRTQYRRDNGVWFEMRERRTRDGGIVTLRVDVTEAHRHEAMLAEQNKLEALGQLAGGVAHEINTLLQPALIFPEIMREHVPPDDAETLEFLELVLDSVRKAGEVVRNVLLFARKQDAKLETVDLATEVGAALAFIRHLLPKGISLSQRNGCAGGLAAINKTQLTQVLTNLLVNAAHATGGKGSIAVDLGQVRPSASQAASLQLEAGAAYLTLAVGDTGSGMDAVTLARIFEPFFTTKPVGEGTGLGLSVVFGILRGWQGAVAVDSAVGRGTTFTLYIPVVVQVAPADATAQIAR